MFKPLARLMVGLSLWVAATPNTCGAGKPVTLTEDTASYTLANDLVTAKISKRSGDLVSLRYQGLELLVGGSGHAYGYWSHAPGAAARNVHRKTIDPATNGGERAEVSVKGYSDGSILGSGPGGGVRADVEIRFTRPGKRGDSGVYTYTIFDHKPGVRCHCCG